MTDRHTVDSITSDALDALYDQLDRAHALAGRWDNALPVDKPYARTLRAALDGPGPAHTHTEPTVTPVASLYKQWVKNGPPPLGTPIARWWDRRLIELRNAIHDTTSQTKES